MKPRRGTFGRLATMIVATLIGTSGGVAWAAFSATTSNGPDSFTAAPDWIPPTVSSSVIARTTGYLSGTIRQGGTYYIYANVTDTGNPASGVGTVTADVSAITTGATSVALSPGSFTSNGVSYNYRSASLTAQNLLAAGAYAYSLAMADGAGNSGTQSGFSIAVDNTVPTAVDVQAADVAGTLGRAQQSDTMTLTYSEPIDPYSFVAGWTGASKNVVVHINNVPSDTFEVFDATNTTQLPLFSVDLKKTTVSSNITFGATGTPSTMVLSGTTLTITLGTVSDATKTATAGPGKMEWSPSATVTDAAGNACSVATVTELGVNDRDF